MGQLGATALGPTTEPIAVPLKDIWRYGGPKRAEAYEEVKAKRLRAVKRGRNTLVLMKDLKTYLESLPEFEPVHATASVQSEQSLQRRRSR